MDWKDVAKTVGEYAPLVGGALGGPLGAGIGAVVSHALGVENTPDAVAEAVKTDPEAAVKLQQAQLDAQVELRKLTVAQATAEVAAETARLSENSQNYRAELASSDPFVRRMRPAWGYTLCASWALTAVGVVYSVVFHPKEAPDIITAIASMSMMWSVALAVLGVYVHKRSQDKQTAVGIVPTTLLDIFKKKEATK